MGNLFIVSRLNVLLLCLDWLVSIACQRDIHNNLTKRCENQKKKEKSEKFSPSCFFRQLFVVETSQTRTKEEPKEHCRLKCSDAFASPENETYIVNCGRTPFVSLIDIYYSTASERTLVRTSIITANSNYDMKRTNTVPQSLQKIDILDPRRTWRSSLHF